MEKVEIHRHDLNRIQKNLAPCKTHGSDEIHHMYSMKVQNHSTDHLNYCSKSQWMRDHSLRKGGEQMPYLSKKEDMEIALLYTSISEEHRL